MGHSDTPPDSPPRRPLSDARLAANRANAQKSTGPRTDEGKARCSRNAWKTGMHSGIHELQMDAGLRSLVSTMGKPCLSTCPIHPDNPDCGDSPCRPVQQGLTRAGGNCMDKQVYVEAFGHIINAVESRDFAGVNGIMATEIAAAVQMLHDLRRQISDQGLVVAIPAIDADGKVIQRADGSEVIAKLIANPGYALVLKTLEVLGISLPELLATPAAANRAKTEGETAGAMQTLLGGIMQRSNAGRALPAKVIASNGD